MFALAGVAFVLLLVLLSILPNKDMSESNLKKSASEVQDDRSLITGQYVPSAATGEGTEALAQAIMRELEEDQD